MKFVAVSAAVFLGALSSAAPLPAASNQLAARDFFSDLGNDFTNFGNEAANTATNIGNDIVGAANTAGNAIVGAANTAETYITNTANTVGNAIVGTADAGVSEVTQIANNAGISIANGASMVAGDIYKAAASAGMAITNSVTPLTAQESSMFIYSQIGIHDRKAIGDIQNLVNYCTNNQDTCKGWVLLIKASAQFIAEVGGYILELLAKGT